MVAGALRIVVDIALIGLIGTAVWGVVEIVGSARSLRRLTDELGATMPGLIERANCTLDSLNSELDRVGGVVTQLEEVSDRVSHTTRAARDIVEAPAAAVSGLAEGIRSFFSVLAGRRH